MFVCRDKSQPTRAGKGMFSANLSYCSQETRSLFFQQGRFATAIAMVVLIFGINLWSQQIPFTIPSVNHTGFPEGASFEGANESINLNNGGVLVVLPLLKL